MKDLALLHHWSTSTTITLSAATWTHHVWTIVVPRIAFQHSYLMHGILAIAALHMAYLTPTSSRDLHIDAAGHYDEAIRGFREAMADINEQNCDAMFATSIIIMFYIFAVTSRDDVVSAPKPPPRDLEVLDAKWISLVRGCGAVLSPAYEYVSRGPLKAFLEIGDLEILDPDKNPNEDDERLVALKNIWDSDYGDVNRKEAYSKTLYCLRQTLQWMGDHAMSDSRIYWAGPFIWLHIIPDAYLELLWQRQPPALILFAYFGALVHQLDGFWWAEGWGRKIVGAVDESLGPYWRPRIEWPIQVEELVLLVVLRVVRLLLQILLARHPGARVNGISIAVDQGNVCCRRYRAAIDGLPIGSLAVD